jgi:hypothetical protein
VASNLILMLAATDIFLIYIYIYIHHFFVSSILGLGREGVPGMEEQRREHKVRGQRQPEGVQGGRAQGRVEARLRQRLPIHCHVRRRFSARVRFSLEDHPFPCAQPRDRPCPDSLEIRLVTLVAIIRFTS